MLTHADTCHYMSLIDQHQKIHAMELQLQVAAMISQGTESSLSVHLVLTCSNDGLQLPHPADLQVHHGLQPIANDALKFTGSHADASRSHFQHGVLQLCMAQKGFLSLTCCAGHCQGSGKKRAGTGSCCWLTCSKRAAWAPSWTPAEQETTMLTIWWIST